MTTESLGREFHIWGATTEKVLLHLTVLLTLVIGGTTDRASSADVHAGEVRLVTSMSEM